MHKPMIPGPTLSTLHLIAGASPRPGLLTDGNGFFDLLQFAGLVPATLIAWYVAQRILGLLLVRKSNAFCPSCGSAQIKEVPRSSRYRVAPFLRRFSCKR